MSTVTTARPRVAPKRPRANTPQIDHSVLPPHLGGHISQPVIGAPGPHAAAPASAVADARTWIRQIRCHQWTKNLLVLAAPAAADALGHTAVAARAALAFVVFCLLSSATYLLNDVVDADEDRRHPVKRHRPVASGAIAVPEALIAAGGCLVVALASAATVGIQLLLIALAYAGLNLAYTSWARRVPLLDIVAVAACFLLRAVAGGVATGIPISPWFVVVVTLSALLVASGKRYAEVIDPRARRARAVLRRYDPALLRRVGIGACAGAILAYALWAVAGGHTDVAALRELSLLPFAAALVRYLKLAGEGEGAAPEKLLLEDHQIQLSGLVWLMLFLVGA